MPDANPTQRETAILLTRIQEACRAYPTQGESARKMTFATIRTAADTIASITADAGRPAVAEGVQRCVNRVNACLDGLADRYGSDEPDACRACGSALRSAQLGGGTVLRYCTRCPSDILEAVRDISDLTGAEVL